MKTLRSLEANRTAVLCGRRKLNSSRFAAVALALLFLASFLPTVHAVPTTSVSRTCSVTEVAGWCRGTITVTISCTPTAGSQYVSTAYRVDAGSYTTVTTNPHAFAYTTEGSHTVEAICTDNVPSTSSGSTSFAIDSTAPRVTSATMPFAVVGGSTYTVSLTVGDTGSGLTGTLNIEEGRGGYAIPVVGLVSGTWTSISQTTVSGSSASVTFTRTPPGAGTYCYRATVSDVAGNTLDAAPAFASGTFLSDNYACVTYAPMI